MTGKPQTFTITNGGGGNPNALPGKSVGGSGLTGVSGGLNVSSVVLVGANTAGRKWIKHEISKSWDDGMGVVGIHIHGLKNKDGKVSTKGKNPFASIGYGKTGKSSLPS